MKVEEFLQQVDNYIGQVVELEGYLLVTIDENETAYLSAIDTLDDTAILIEQPLAELRKIIQPMPGMILSHRGALINPPYLYNFPLTLSAQIALTDEDKPTLRDIQTVRLWVDHPPNMAEWISQQQYLYTAEVEYEVSHDLINNHPVKAKIMSHHVLQFGENDNHVRMLDPNANAYARLLTNKTVTIPGWLKYMPGLDSEPYQFVLRTFAVRASMMGVGPLKGMTSIWWRPDPLYKIVRSHMLLAEDVPDTNRRVDISGQIDYIGDEVVPISGDTHPNLAFSRIAAVTVHREDYLLEASHNHTR